MKEKFTTKLKHNTLVAFVSVCLAIISQWPPLSHRLLWFW